MDLNEIIEMAKEAGLSLASDRPYDLHGLQSQLFEFAKLVAAKEREACAKIVEDSWMAFSRASNVRLEITPFPELSYVAKAIRARS